MDELDVADLTPLSHKPLKPGDDRTSRKSWTYRADADLDSVRIAIDKQLAEVER